MMRELHRRLPVGAELQATGGAHFRVWAPLCQKVQVVLEGDASNFDDSQRNFDLVREPHGYFSGLVNAVGNGTLYRYRLDGRVEVYPDPASRFQPTGPKGPSEVVGPEIYEWSDANWPGIQLDGQVLYEMHIGTFTSEGTFAGALEELPALAELGVTAIELMPVADFMGKFGWGYDGVNLFAPTHLYGRPDDFRRFVDSAHSLGLAVILDVVYNHLGPDGNYLNLFSDSYFSDRYKTDWGEAINYDAEFAGPVREFFCSNAEYWITEYHLDGLRLDATTEIFDQSEGHILAEISQRARKAAAGRSIILVAENEAQQVKLVRPVDEGGYGLDALWNDDFHHTAFTALSGRKEAYYTDYEGTPQEFISCIKWGYLYQGQFYKWQKKRRGTPTFGLQPSVFVNYLESHDQIANSARGLRCHQLTSPGSYRALTALMLLGPGTPMLFQGQEFASSKPFLYFADHKPDLTRLIYEGRKEFLHQFPSFKNSEDQNLVPDPSDPNTFVQCVLDFSERKLNEPMYRMHRDLLRLRKSEAVFHVQRHGSVDGAVLSQHAFVLRFFAHHCRDIIIVINLGIDLHLDPAPEPLLAPPEGMLWDVLWSSEDPQYGGIGTPPLETEENWLIPGQATVVLFPKSAEGD
jgi:maltooligosyltrehalose trehalohydrolase